MSALPRPSAVLFDIGGTLLREDGYDLRAGVERLVGSPAFPGPRTPETVDALTADLAERVRRVHQEGDAEFRIADWIQRALGEHAGRVDTAQFELALWSRIGRLSPAPGVEEALGLVQALGLPAGAVSNAIFTARTLEAELARHRLASALRFVLSSADVGVRKPDARIFEEALARAGTSAGDTWFVGDSWEADVVGAGAAGMTAIWLSPEPAPAGGVPHRRVDGWREFAALLRSAA